jgi:hypothetical protein
MTGMIVANIGNLLLVIPTVIIPLLLLFLRFVFAGLNTRLPLPSQVISYRPQEDRDCPRGVLPPTGLGHFRGRSPLWGTPGIAPNAYSKPGLFNLWGFTTQALPQDGCFVGALPPAIFAPGAFPHWPPLAFFGHQAWTSLCCHHSVCNISARMT